MRPRILLVGRTRYRLPLAASLARKFEALGDQVDVRVLAAESRDSLGDDWRFRLVRRFPVRRLDGLAFWSSLPFRVARQLRSFHPDAIVAQSPYEATAALLGRTLARSQARIVVDVHGDWRTATRLYGSASRRVLAPIGDRLALTALRRADAVRAVSDYTASLVREVGLEPARVFPAFMDLEPFVTRAPLPLPRRPQALFVGVLELYKNIDGLAAAWRLAAPRLAPARLVIVGSGARERAVEELVAELPAQTMWVRRLGPDEIARLLDESTALVLPSRSEGMGRVVVEAFCRGRPVVGARIGGIPELVSDGGNGLLVQPDEPSALAAAIVRVLEDRELAERLGANAYATVESWLESPATYADALRALIENAAPRLRER